MSVRRCGTAFSIAVRMPCRLSGRWLAWKKFARPSRRNQYPRHRRRNDSAARRNHAAYPPMPQMLVRHRRSIRASASPTRELVADAIKVGLRMTLSNSAVVVADGVVKQFGRFAALRGVTAEFAPGRL